MDNLEQAVNKPNKTKKKIKKHIIITSNDVASKPTEISYNPTVVLVVCIVLCVMVGVLIGMIFFEKQKDSRYENRLVEMETVNASLNDVNLQLNENIESLEDTVEALSNTVNAKTEHENSLMEEIEKQSVPTSFPMSDSAKTSPYDDEEPGVLFTALSGGTIIATASGKVVEVYDDEDFGTVIVIDHLNGYKTFFKNRGDSLVREGDTVVLGTTLFLIGNDNTNLYYQISYNSEYLYPMDLLDIKG